MLGLLDHIYHLNDEEPPPVDPDAVQFDTGVGIEPPTLCATGRDNSSDDELDVRSVGWRDVRSAPPMLLRAPSRKPG